MVRNLFAVIFVLLSAAAVAQSPLKASFGQGGKMSYSPDQFNDVADIMTISGDSLLVLAYCGHADTMYFDMDIALTKMDALGNIDPSFGQGGTAKHDFDGMDYSTASCLLACSDGRILVMGAGYSFADPSYNPVCLLMLTAEGQVDSSFGTNGTARIGFYGKHEIAAAITTDINGSTLIAGASVDTSDNENVPVIGRFTNYSNADSAFGGTGKLVIDFAAGLQSLKTSEAHLAGGVAMDVLALDDGSLLVGGSYAADCFVAKLLPNGMLDSSFSNDGYILFQAEPLYNNVVTEMTALPGGMILLGITSDKTYDRDYYLGTLDPVTGSLSGVEYVDHAAYEDMLSGVAITPQGAVVAAGRCIRPENALTAGYRSDYFSVVIFHDPEQLGNQQKILAQYDPLYQSGALAVAVQSDGTIVCAGFTNTAITGRTDIALIAIDPGYYLDVMNVSGADNTVSAFPNPARNDLRVRNAEPGSLITLENALGQVIHATVADADQTSISLEGLAPGIYFLSLEDQERNKQVLKIIKE